MSQAAYLWEGIYASFDEVPVEGPGFAGDVWVERTSERTAACLAAYRSGHLIADKDSSLLPLLAATLLGKQEKIRILDFGGGMGVGYIHCLNALSDKAGLSYHVVESSAICSKGRQLHGSNENIAFSTAWPLADQSYDIVYANSVLQYIADYASLIRQLASYGAPHILLARTSANQNKTYATAQLNLPGSKLAYWFLNLQELHALMAEQDYLPVFSDESGDYNQENFPPEYRMHRTTNILYKRC